MKRGVIRRRSPSFHLALLVSVRSPKVWRIRMHLTGRPSLAALAVAMTIAAGVALLQLQGGGASRAATPVATATRGDVVVSVGGVGRIAEAKVASQISVPGASAGSGSAGGSAAARGTSGPPPAVSAAPPGGGASAPRAARVPPTD